MPAETPRPLAQRVALVTGATSGIGRGIAEHLAGLGAHVVVHGRDEARARAVVAGLTRAGADAAHIVGDLADVETCRNVAQFTIDRFGGIDILVNNAASTERAYLADASV